MNKNNTLKPLALGLVIGSIITFGAYSVFQPGTMDDSSMSKDAAKQEPLYWVAPMDANYRRDKPGKSPMGMDLVAVYDDGGKGPDEGPGTIRISPDVINNLGVRTATVSYSTMHTQINTVGYVVYDEDKLVHVHPRVEGWVEKLFVKSTGDRVKKGQPLYQLYSPELVNAQEELLLAIMSNNKRLINAAETRLVTLKLPKSAITQLKKNKKVQHNITFYAPQNGVVENLKIREGFFIKPGSTIMSIGDLSQIWVEAEVFERQAAQVKTGTPVTMTLDYLPGQRWQGKVDYIYPTLDAKTRTVKVRLRFSNEHGLFKPNMFAQIAIHTNSDERVLLIPKEALIRTGSQDRVVLALGEGSFKSIEVSVGRLNNNKVEILTGLLEGEKVVSSAQFLIDSESSKSSDFKRMNYADDTEEIPTSVWVEAKIQSMMVKQKMLTLVHEPIPQWRWPEMTMDFIVSDAIDFSKLSAGLTLHVELTTTSEGEYQVSNIHIPGDESMGEMDMLADDDVSTATVTGVINSVMSDHRMLNISRGPIEKWDRPAATLDFLVSDEIDMSALSAGQEVSFTFEIRNGDFIIINIELTTGASTDETPVDHSNH
ncbi:efflux transporter periplasmic adaptor subunit [Thalassotalea sp. 42_200_T64]|nr:efflux transporter periplasmic adaptor subunit [Thalassotalea sp. 42_200_T64]